LLSKLYDLGVIDKKSSLAKAERLAAAAFARRRLPVTMVTFLSDGIGGRELVRYGEASRHGVSLLKS